MMFVLFDLEWITAEDGTRTMTQLAALRTDTAWRPQDAFCVLVKPERGEHDWAQVAYNGYSPDEFWAGLSEQEALASFLEWLEPDDTLCCWHYQNGKTLAALQKRWADDRPPHRWLAVNQIIYSLFARKGILEPGGLYDCARLRGLSVPVPEHCSCNDVDVLQRLLRGMQLPTRSLRSEHKKKPVSISLSPAERREQNALRIQKAQYHYVYLPDSPVFHRWDCRLVLNARQVTGCVHYKTAARKRRPCRVCRPEPDLLTQQETEHPEEIRHRSAELAEKRRVEEARNEVVNVRLLSGSRIQIRRKLLVGCCHNRIHPGKLTQKLMEDHNCLGKGCRFFEKYETADYWRELARKTAVKQNVRQQRNRQKEQAQQQEAALLSLKDQFQTYADDAGYVIKIIRVQEEKKGILKIYYVSENRFRDGNLFPNFLSRIRKEYPRYSILMRHIQDLDGCCVTIEEYDRLRK